MRQLLAEVDSRELSEWIAFEQVETSESWLRTARICLTIAQSVGDKKSKLEDFLPRRKKKIQPAGDLRSKILAWAARFNSSARARVPSEGE